MDDQTKTQGEGMMGRLPASAPLANPYVPFQLENPPRYEPRRGLIRGTIYPGLDLPFMGMANTKEKPDAPLPNLQALQFALHDTALYLDTHPDDQEALAQYQALQQASQEFAKEFSENHMQLNHSFPTTGGTYRWLQDPWPWEYSANKEG